MKIILLLFLICSWRAVRGLSSCPTPSVADAQPTGELKDSYSSGDTVRFDCNHGYRFEGTRFALCDDGTWSLPVCKALYEKCSAPHVKNGKPEKEFGSSYRSGDTVRFVCDSGFVFKGTHYALCDKGTWRLPVCKDPTCTAPHVENARPEKELGSSYAGGETVSFVCDSNHELEGTSYAVCDDGTWSLPVCKERIKCGRPEVRNSDPDSTLRDSYNIGERVQFRCLRRYEFIDTDYGECVETGTWILPVCIPRSAVVCEAPGISHGRPVGTLSQSYPTGASVRFRCDSGYGFEGTEFAVCINRRWILPVCERTGGSAGSENRDPSLPVRLCGDQPLIENGDVTELPGGEELRVQCKVLYKLVGPEIVRCVSGGWTETPVCKPPCKLDKSRISSSHDEYLMEGERKSFYCPLRFFRTTIQCTNGQATYSNCLDGQ